jgi:tetratricopeptide (TPR) repeat protein
VPLSLPLPGVIAGILIAAGALTQTRATSYPDIIDRYRSGAFEAAVVELLSIPDGHSADRVERELEAIVERTTSAANADRSSSASGGRRQPVATALDALLPAAALIHLEAGYHALQQADGTRGGAHLMIAGLIAGWKPWADALRGQPEALRRHAALQRDIEIGIVWTLQTYRSPAPLRTQFRRLQERYPRDPDVLVALGSYYESQSTPAVRAGSLPEMGTDPVSHRRMIEAARRAAMDHYREALGLDPAHVEARVRLGRVLQLRGDLKEARAVLEDALDPEPPMVLHYLGSLFLAELLEAQGDADGALAHYRAIAARWPECQTAHVALSRAHAARGERDEAARVLAPLWREPAERACRDPWWIYRLGQGWRFGSFVEALRARVRAK